MKIIKRINRQSIIKIARDCLNKDKELLKMKAFVYEYAIFDDIYIGERRFLFNGKEFICIERFKDNTEFKVISYYPFANRTTQAIAKRLDKTKGVKVELILCVE